MKFHGILVWTFTILAFAFFFFSLRSNGNEMFYAVIALVMWGIAFLINKMKPGEK
jgi:hypothetical protein